MHQGILDAGDAVAATCAQAGSTVLIRASIAGHAGVVQALLAAGADKDAKSTVGCEGHEKGRVNRAGSKGRGQ